MIRYVTNADAGAERRDKLRKLVIDRRRERQLSVSAAARAAQISRGTWIALESGTRETEDYNYAGIERALQWQPGSIDDILDGGDPTPIKSEQTPNTLRVEWEDKLAKVQAIADNPDRPQHMRDLARGMISQIEAILAADRAEEQRRESAG
jgi:hypothetical protein